MSELQIGIVLGFFIYSALVTVVALLTKDEDETLSFAIGIVPNISIVYMNKKVEKSGISFSGGTLNTIIKNIYKITIVPIVNPIVVHRFFLRSISNSFSFGTTYFA